jgi:uncharacterized secreted protein with C-terminal beta-propeller domain
MHRHRRRTVRSSARPVKPGFAPQCERLESRFALAVSFDAGIWAIDGDADPGKPNDTIVIDRNPSDPKQLRAVVNGVVIDVRAERRVVAIRVNAGVGDDTIAIDVPGNSRLTTMLAGGLGDDVIRGSDGRDTIVGGPGRDTLNGGKGDDSIRGGANADSLSGGLGNDTLFGGLGRDTLRGDGGRNILDGGMGVDRFFGRKKADIVRLAADERLVSDETTNPLDVLDDLSRLESWYVDTALAQWSGQLGREAWSTIWCGIAPGGAGTAATSVSTVSPGSSDDFSGNNNQVAGVEEGDLVQTDGQHLFTIAGDGIDIVTARPADQLAVVSHVATPGLERSLFLHGTRLTVVSQQDDWSPVVVDAAVPIDFALRGWGHRWEPRVVVTVIDVSNAGSPAIVETTSLDGWLVEARGIDGRVLVVTQNRFDVPIPAIIELPQPDPISFIPLRAAEPGSVMKMADGEPQSSGLFPGNTGRTRYVYEDEASYRSRLKAAWEQRVIPGFRVTLASGVTTTGDLVVAGYTYLPRAAGDNNLLSIVSFDVTDDTAGPDVTTSVAGVSGSIYASAANLYVSSANVGNWWDAGDTGQSTNIFRFDLRDADLPLTAMGAVPGVALDQFSFDEAADGLLRVATTNGFGDAASSGVYVLAATAGNLEVIGSVAELAPGERIFSVRFLGDRGYVSTFRQVDPLFVIDLATPTAPRVAGELKVPGFSSYLQPLDDTHLLGVGRDVDADTGRVLGLQLSIFDVADPSRPRRTSTHTFAGNNWESWSPALWDHHALSWFGGRSVLALPVQQGGGWEIGNALIVFKVDPNSEHGFTTLGEIRHDGPVERSLRIGEFLYSVSAGQVQAHRLDDPTIIVGSATLTTGTTVRPEYVLPGIVAW